MNIKGHVEKKDDLSFQLRLEFWKNYLQIGVGTRFMTAVKAST